MSTAAREIFDDLLTLEVNIIVKSGMTARKMPDLSHALVDIVSDYDLWLCELAGRYNHIWTRLLSQDPRSTAFRNATGADSWLVDDRGEPILELPYQPLYTGEDTPITAATFDALRTRARAAEAMFRLFLLEQELPDDGSAIILKRIYRNCDQIKGILEGRAIDGRVRSEEMEQAARRGVSRRTKDPRALPLTADEILVVRKVWEVGTEAVVMQTVAQLDGDVITRVQRARLGPDDKPVHDLHRDAVGNALKHWQFLVDTLVQITTRAAGFLAR
jgi:hypothetical protein